MGQAPRNAGRKAGENPQPGDRAVRLASSWRQEESRHLRRARAPGAGKRQGDNRRTCKRRETSDQSIPKLPPGVKSVYTAATRGKLAWSLRCTRGRKLLEAAPL